MPEWGALSAFRMTGMMYGVVAQLGEHLPCTQGVGSSILPGSTKKQQSIDIDESSMASHDVLACMNQEVN